MDIHGIKVVAPVANNLLAPSKLDSLGLADNDSPKVDDMLYGARRCIYRSMQPTVAAVSTSRINSFEVKQVFDCNSQSS